MSRARTIGTFNPMPASICAMLDERREVLLVGRRIHDDVGIGPARQTKISAKARIRGGRLDAAVGKSEILRRPTESAARVGNHLHPVHPCLTIHTPQMRRLKYTD